jgi:hypothetical protein
VNREPNGLKAEDAERASLLARDVAGVPDKGAFLARGEVERCRPLKLAAFEPIKSREELNAEGM